MAGDHLIQISWNGGDLAEVRPYALKYHKKVIDKPEYSTEAGKVKLWEAERFFEEAASGKSYFGGIRGNLWLWGTVAKFPDMEAFLQEIIPFFKELWEKDIILKLRPVLLFDEHMDEHAKWHIIIYNDKDNEHVYKNIPLNQVAVLGAYSFAEICWET